MRLAQATTLKPDLETRPVYVGVDLVESPETKPRPKLPLDRTAAVPTQKDRLIVEVDRTGVTASRAEMNHSRPRASRM